MLANCLVSTLYPVPYGGSKESSMSLNFSFKVHLPETIDDLKNIQNQVAGAPSLRVPAFHEHFAAAYKRGVMRSGVETYNTVQYRFHGLYLQKKDMNRLHIGKAKHEVLSKFRRMVMQELIERTGLTEEEICIILDINIVKNNKNDIIWNKKESYRQKPAYQTLLTELQAQTPVVPLKAKYSREQDYQTEDQKKYRVALPKVLKDPQVKHHNMQQ